MSIETREAEFLCTGSEFQLYLESVDPWVRQFRADRIRMSMQRALKLSVLWQAKAESDRTDVHQRKGKAKLRSITGHVLARRKAELFDQVAQRLGNRLHALGEIRRLGHGIPAEEYEDNTDFQRL
jgi:hypothetical protein